MKQKQPLFLSAILIIAILSVIFDSDEHISYAQVCGAYGMCLDTGFTNSCIPAPTTIPPVDIHTAGDWYVPESDLGSHCGTARCYYLFNCQCGPPLAQRLCSSSEKGQY